MSDALLEAIRRSPADDAPRLVYADWLEEAGDPDRAAFVRAQCRGDGDRAADLLAANDRHWLGPAGVPLTDFRFERGFLHAVAGPLEGVEAWWPALRAAHPLVSHARLLPPSEDNGAILRFFGRDAPEGLTGLRLPGVLTVDQFEALVGWPGLPRLAHLNLRGSLQRYRVGADGLRRLLHAPGLRLESLSLANNVLIGDDVTTLALSPTARTLKSLDLSGNPIYANGAERLLAAGELVELRHLSLARCSIEVMRPDRPSPAWAEPACERLESLDLSDNALTANPGVDSLLAVGPMAERLHSLGLGHGSWTLDRVGRLLARGRFGRLSNLSMLVYGGSAALADIPQLGQLRRLAISGGMLTAATAARVLARLADGAIRSLALGPVDSGKPGDLVPLLTSAALARLRDLSLTLSNAGWPDVGSLLAALPRLELESLSVAVQWRSASAGRPAPIRRPLPEGGFPRLHTLSLSLGEGNVHALAALADTLAPGALRRVAAADGRSTADECARLAASPAWRGVRRWWTQLPAPEAARFDVPGNARDRLPNLRELGRVDGFSALAVRAYLPPDGGPAAEVLDDRGALGA